MTEENLAEKILEAIKKAEEERTRLGVSIAENIERLKELGIYDKKEEKRYLFISCAGNGYPGETYDFLRNFYIKNNEYYDYLARTGSVLSLIVPDLDYYCGLKNLSENLMEDYNFFVSLYGSLRLQVKYLIKKHKLNKVVVVGEPDCAFYKDLFSFVSARLEKRTVIVFPSQKNLFLSAIFALEDFLSFEFGRGKIELEAYYIFLLGTEVLFEKVYDSRYKDFYLKSTKF